ncbi:L,D-transpeptidase [Phyllobacterium sp. 0TCS1.6C]|uniref:L,D-transpeptidase n=1 Tax=unclassified Phyllobacterium TaxID=2638441 RepID=UPI0022646F4A|nr:MULTISPECIES: L,D-transpeptidase [unclassified Phyllobacterium]MCX8280042.1 L,D-transpeptidase [Phyllobacterium sp. 0TCS1.6C]MCX8296209.1 L,D-transpeptidase [Phyllobacterium sp. 0TCS1.6A]
MALDRCLLVGLVLGLSAGTSAFASPYAPGGIAGQKAYTLAQFFERERYSRREEPRAYIDEYGRRVIVDRRGRIVSIEEPDSRYDQGADYFPEPPQDPYDTGAISNDPYPRGEPLPSEQDYGNVDRAPLPPADSGPGLYDPTNPQDNFGAQQEQIPAHPNPAPSVELPKGQGAKAKIAAIQVLLDRIGVSPGVIDGRKGGNVDKAVAAFEEMTGQQFDPLNEEGINASLEQTGGPAFVSYTITAEDAAYPFVASIPEDYGHKAQLERMAFTSVAEMLAERFHMDEAYLKEINKGLDFNTPGITIQIANIGQSAGGGVTRIIADKGRKQVRGYNAEGKLVVAYPATIGSSDTPSPSGTVQVERIALNPNYTYNPKLNFKQGQNDKVLTIPPGPNGPVGTVWIALSKPTYGIHGTPEPSKIGKTSSHGCVRLTNWDATELSKLVQKGVTVEFHE